MVCPETNGRLLAKNPRLSLLGRGCPRLSGLRGDQDDQPDEPHVPYNDPTIPIPANIAEGTGRNTLKEYVQFLYTARGSIEETRYHLMLSRDLGYLAPEHFRELVEGYIGLTQKIVELLPTGAYGLCRG